LLGDGVEIYTRRLFMVFHIEQAVGYLLNLRESFSSLEQFRRATASQYELSRKIRNRRERV
jgi:hypothetical protein